MEGLAVSTFSRSCSRPAPMRGSALRFTIPRSGGGRGGPASPDELLHSRRPWSSGLRRRFLTHRRLGRTAWQPEGSESSRYKLVAGAKLKIVSNGLNKTCCHRTSRRPQRQWDCGGAEALTAHPRQPSDEHGCWCGGPLHDQHHQHATREWIGGMVKAAPFFCSGV